RRPSWLAEHAPCPVVPRGVGGPPKARGGARAPSRRAPPRAAAPPAATPPPASRRERDQPRAPLAGRGHSQGGGRGSAPAARGAVPPEFGREGSRPGDKTGRNRRGDQRGAGGCVRSGRGTRG